MILMIMGDQQVLALVQVFLHLAEGDPAVDHDIPDPDGVPDGSGGKDPEVKVTHDLHTVLHRLDQEQDNSLFRMLSLLTVG